MNPDYSKPITITSGLAVTKDCIVVINTNEPAGNYQSRNNIWFSVNGNRVFDSVNLVDGTYGYIALTGKGNMVIPLKAGDVPTWSNIFIYGYEPIS